MHTEIGYRARGPKVRNRPVNVKYDEDEHAVVARAAKARGLSVASFMAEATLKESYRILKKLDK